MPATLAKRVLITVKTYPVPAAKTIEASCTAGITEDRQWIRLFPIPYRLLRDDQQFAKYEWVEAQVTKARADTRPESFRIDCDTIQVLSDPISTADNWRERKEWLAPLVSPSLCHLKRQRDAKGEPTLGLFRPKAIRRLVIEKDAAQWTPDELAKLRQLSLFGHSPQFQLKKVPFRFSYEFECNDDHCGQGHRLMCTDWEMAAAYLKYVRKYGSEWESKFRQKFEGEMMEKNDTHFYVGTVHSHPQEWIVIGLFYPRREAA